MNEEQTKNDYDHKEIDKFFNVIESKIQLKHKTKFLARDSFVSIMIQNSKLLNS